ncbi:arabinogalactan oligomer / maltooligosaccharide transport system permease protein, partial [Candidatus Hakubella thermalkaliphila]
NPERLTNATYLYTILTITAIACVYPILWVIMASFNPGTSLFSATLIPDRLTTAHYFNLFVEREFGLWYRNTLNIAFWTMILAVALVIPTAYALSQFRFKGRRLSLMSMLVLQMFPSFMFMIAIYLLLLQLRLLDTHIGLILVYAGGAIPFGSWLLTGSFDGIPRSLAEAAKIDGASNATVFTKIMLPLSSPIITFVALSNFIAPWMDFILARLVLRSSGRKTLAIGLFEMVTGYAHTEFTMFAAGSVMVAIPITILFIFLQRYIVQGLTEGASKI